MTPTPIQQCDAGHTNAASAAHCDAAHDPCGLCGNFCEHVVSGGRCPATKKEAPMNPVDLIVTRHASLVDYLREIGLATDATPVIEHVTDAAVLDGRRVAGVLPLHLAARCAAVVEVPIHHTPETRARWAKSDGGLDELRALAGAPVEYVCRTAQAYAVALRDAANGGFHEGAALAESR